MAIYSIEIKSKHPIAKAICDYIKFRFEKIKKNLTLVDIDNFEEIYGIGVTGSYNGNNYEIRGDKVSDTENCIQILKNTKD